MPEERLSRTDDEVPVEIEERTAMKDSLVRIVPVSPVSPNADANAYHQPLRRDWNSAIELVKEAAEAVRLSDERALSAERYSQDLAQFYNEQAKAAEIKIAGLEKRVESAEARAQEAEAWLLRFHDAIMTGFTGVLKKK